MTSVNPLQPLILKCGRGTAASPADAGKVAELQALATARPDLLNVPMTDRAPELPLDGALYWGSLPAAQALTAAAKAAGVALRTVGGPPLVQAANSCNPGLVQWVFATGLDTAVTAAVGEAAVTIVGPADERLQVVQFLLSKGVPVSPLMAVQAAQSYPAVAGLLVTSGALGPEAQAAIDAQVRPATSNPLAFALLPDKTNDVYVAIHGGSVPALQALLSGGSPVNIVLPGASRLGTPLHYALRLGAVPMAQALLAAGADPGRLSQWGQSIVGAAALSGSTPALQAAVAAAPAAALVDAVERAFVPSRNGTPLVAVIIQAVPNVVDAVRVLLAAGADPTDASTVGVPPAYWPLYGLGSSGPAMTPAIATAIIRALAAGNSRGKKAPLDTVCPAVGKTVRAFALEKGIAL